MADDFNSNIGSTRVAVTKKYKDLPLSFLQHPGTKDIRPITDIDAVKQSVKNIVLTNFGERPFQPEIGSNVTSYLFEPADGMSGYMIEEEIKNALKEQEPRVNGVSVKVSANIDNNALTAKISYNVISLNVSVSTSFYLTRLR
tara:strand:- start:816 stop:1244 length:429 start_codon:yes stop_codon:yes gene_type:complete